jgi:hypothetical protein
MTLATGCGFNYLVTVMASGGPPVLQFHRRYRPRGGLAFRRRHRRYGVDVGLVSRVVIGVAGGVAVFVVSDLLRRFLLGRDGMD